jgi:hypothetical protein
MEHEAFVSGHFYTDFVSKYFTPAELIQYSSQEAEVAASLVTFLLSQQQTNAQPTQTDLQNTSGSKWKKNRP